MLLLSFKYPNTTTAQEFIIGVEDVSYYPLYNFSANNTTKPSFTRELLATFFEQHNYRYRFVALPLNRFDKWYLEDNIDFKFPDNIKWREQTLNKLDITFSLPVIKLMSGSYMLASKQHYRREDIKTLGTIIGFTPTLWFDKLEGGQLAIIEESSPVSIIKHLTHENIDATNIDASVIRHNLSLLSKDIKIQVNKNIPYEIFAFHLSSVKHPQIIEEFNHFLSSNKALINKLKIKYHIEKPLNSFDIIKHKSQP